MSKSNDHHRLDAELLEVADRLREQKPTLSALELDRTKLRARTQAASGNRMPSLGQKGTLLYSRLTVMLLLAFGIFLSGTGATLALSGSSSPSEVGASPAQYNDDDDSDDSDDSDDDSDDSDDDSDDSDDDSDDSDDSTPLGDELEIGGVLPSFEESPAPAAEVESETAESPSATAAEAPVQPVRQAAAQGEETLPFTGFAAIPILLAGVGMLAGGLVLRRRVV